MIPTLPILLFQKTINEIHTVSNKYYLINIREAYIIVGEVPEDIFIHNRN